MIEQLDEKLQMLTLAFQTMEENYSAIVSGIEKYGNEERLIQRINKLEQHCKLTQHCEADNKRLKEQLRSPRHDAEVTNSKIMLIEQEKGVAFHTSSRNTGKVHAPFLYDPTKKKFFAKAASFGYEMWKEYCRLKSLPFMQDGVIEVATSENGVERLNICYGVRQMD